MVPPIFINVPPVSDIFESIAHFLNEEGYRKCINRFKEKTCMAICAWTYIKYKSKFVQIETNNKSTAKLVNNKF